MIKIIALPSHTKKAIKIIWDKYVIDNTTFYKEFNDFIAAIMERSSYKELVRILNNNKLMSPEIQEELMPYLFGENDD